VAIVEKMPLLAGKGALVWTVLGIAAIPSTLLWDRIARALGPVAALLLAYGLQIVSIALPIVSDGLAWNLVGALLYGGTFAGIVSLALALVGSRFPANPAKAMARLTLGYGAAQIIAPALAGSIAAATGSYQGALAVAAAVMAVGMLLLAALRAPER
ncbi:MAG TPA: YbfB/YjiJ family MFS transporter, partial [Alicycliphilus sp.]|nr:YbfB/YjiJ family MFS transporter [Alicycliphilus sp.]